MPDAICIFEDEQCENLLPLTYFRPVYDLRCGILSLRGKILRAYPGSSQVLHCRPYLADLVREQNPGTNVNVVSGGRALFVNGRLIAGRALAKRIPLKGNDVVFLAGESVVAARVSGDRLAALKQAMDAGPLTRAHFASIPHEAVDERLVRYPWDLVAANGAEIVSDFAMLAGRKSRVRGKVYPGANLVSKKDIFIGDGAKVKPGVVLDAENGPIWIGSNALVFPHAMIEGPAFVGDGSAIKAGAKIYENTSIGEVCKVGGEVEASIIHSYSNKQHDGFLGHSYLAMWVNLGADTNNSDLKNNYGNVKVVINGAPVDSGSMFVGLTMGDHSKSGINTMFNTGTVVGVSSNVFGADFPPKSIPSFCWGGAKSLAVYDLEKALEVARRVMARRKRTLSERESTVFRTIFERTREERAKAGARAGVVHMGD